MTQYIKMFSELKEVFESSDEVKYLDTLKAIAKLMCSNIEVVPIQEFLSSGLLDYVVVFLQPPFRSTPDFVYQALW